MGKKKNKKKQQSEPSNNSYFEPKSPPPASAPPAPPAGEGAPLLGHVSYGAYQQNEQLRDQLQNNNGNNNNNNNNGGPAITNYNHNAIYTGFGDASLRPNTGEANWMDDEILGLSLHEIMRTLQWSNIISCAAVIVLEILVAIFRIFSPTKFVMGCYLAFFASILLRVEITHIIKQHREHMSAGDLSAQETQDLIGGVGSYSRVPNMEGPALRDNFGLVFHPSGKACLLFLMASMCVGQHNNIFELFLGGLFGLNAMLIMYLLFKYPSYQQQEDIPVPKLPALPSANTPRASTWSYYENDASSLWQVTTTIAEGASMLTPAASSYR